MADVLHRPLELVPGSLYALGGDLEVNGWTSWAPDDVRGTQRCSCFLLLTSEEAMLIDCCPAVLRQTVIEQLKSILPADRDLSIFLTRAEYDTSGNIGAIAASLPVKAVYAASGIGSRKGNPFDGFDFALAPAQNARPFAEIASERIPVGDAIPLGDGRRLEVVTAPFRVLAAYWAYDTGTGTLFPSDAFGYTIDTPDISVQEGFRNLASRYWWLPGARTERIAEDLDAIFASRDVQIIASVHGCIFVGRDEVERQRQKMLQMLTLAGSAPAAL